MSDLYTVPFWFGYFQAKLKAYLHKFPLPDLTHKQETSNTQVHLPCLKIPKFCSSVFAK